MAAGDAFCGAWVHDPNKYYFEASFGYYQAKDFFNQDGDRKRIRLAPDPKIPSSALTGTIPSTYVQMEGSLYVEYGVIKNLEAILSFPFYRLSQQQTGSGTFETSGVGDVLFGLKYKLLDIPWLVLSLGFDVGTPTGDDLSEGTVAGKPNQPIPTGSGDWSYAPRLFMSHSFSPVQAYISADIGYRWRTASSTVPYTNDIPWNVDGGYTFEIGNNWFPTMTTFLGLRGLLNTEDVSSSTLFGLVATGNVPGQAFLDLQPGISLNIYDQLSFISSFSYTVWGKNTGAGWTIRSGLSWEN